MFIKIFIQIELLINIHASSATFNKMFMFFKHMIQKRCNLAKAHLTNFTAIACKFRWDMEIYKMFIHGSTGSTLIVAYFTD